jgi:dTDP-4-amino-4,6-dideoxygalactose transaminase
MSDEMITVARPDLSREEEQAVLDVLRSGMLAQGPKVGELEERFADYVGVEYAVALNSGTAALHAALLALGIGKGDEVITTPFTFAATANTIVMTGARPVFVDVDKNTFNLDVEKLESAVTDKTRAIMPVHLYGMPCEMERLLEVAETHSLHVVEDACQAHGASYKGKQVGSIGDIGTFSFYATKNMCAGEGGMVTTNIREVAEKVKLLRHHGQPEHERYTHYILGYNYRMTDVIAAIALEQLKKLPKMNQRRIENARYYNKKLKHIDGLVLPEVPKHCTHVFHQYTVRVLPEFPLSRDEVLEALKQHNIFAAVYYPKPLHLQPFYKFLGYSCGSFPVSEMVAEQVLSLPVHSRLTKENLDRVVGAFEELAVRSSA